MSYWDTSCSLKLYVMESDSATFKSHLASNPIIVASSISRLELWTSLRRKEAESFLYPGEARYLIDCFDEDVARGVISLKELDAALLKVFDAVIEDCMKRTLPIMLRTLDAIHLSTAKAFGETEIVTMDKHMRTAALFLGFTVFPPLQQHPPA